MIEWLISPDCNKCVHLNMTEKEQQNMPSGKYRNHYCEFHKRRVYHKCYGDSNKDHSPYIFPCNECKNERYEHYIRKEIKND